MDVTPQELRDVEIRESFRGYHRDEVDELLERAAATIEHLEHQIRILQERLAAAPGPRASAPATPEPAPAPVPVPDSDVIQRTLILAQRAADEAVAEAQARAQQITGEAEAKAQALVSEAESTARRTAETERRRIESEIAELSAARDALSADVDRLERFAAEYRDRIRQAIEAELAHLAESSASAEPMPIRPTLATEGMVFAPSTPAPGAAAPATPRAAEPEPTAAVPAVPAAPAAPADRRWESAAESAWSPEPAGGWADTGEGLPGTDDWGTDALDDDAFFASLRDAVRDDEPLGPGEDIDDLEGGRKLFRRRR